jgi:type 1 glutamine amidotransferase
MPMTHFPRSLTLLVPLLLMVGCAPAVQADPAPDPARDPIRVLVVTATQGFRHTEAIDVAKQVLPQLAERTEFDFVITEDVGALDAENLRQFDVLFFANSTLRAEPRQRTPAAVEATRTERVANPVTLAQQQAIVDFVRSGKGLAVAHAGLDAFYGWDEYKEMVGGGLFISHPWTQQVRIQVERPTHPVVAHFGDSFTLRDEIYVLDTNPRSTSTVLLALDIESAGRADGHRDAQRDDYPMSWVRRYGEGRVFATKLGHFGDVWSNPDYLEHLLQGMRYAAGRFPTQ